eukprot:scaffold48661_cov28-Phaeocystis_antarctica.AAC.2
MDEQPCFPTWASTHFVPRTICRVPARTYRRAFGLAPGVGTDQRVVGSEPKANDREWSRLGAALLRHFVAHEKEADRQPAAAAAALSIYLSPAVAPTVLPAMVPAPASVVGVAAATASAGD